MQRRRLLVVEFATLLLAVVLAYADSLRVPFLFDDTGAVVDNATIRDLASFAWLRPPADGSTATGRPLVNLTFALNYALGGENVFGYHAVNLAIHGLATLLLFGLVARTLAQRGWAQANRIAFLAALLWALHPLQTETVVCIAQRTESLCALFYLLTLYAFARGWLAASVIAAFAGMASKEVMVTAPLLVLLYDRTFVAGSFVAAWRARRGYYLALASSWLLLATLVLVGRGARGVSAGFALGVSPWEYLLTQAKALLVYLQLALWPHPLVLDYGTATVRSLADVWWQSLSVLALLAATLWALLRRPVAGFLGASFFLVLAPSSSVVPLVTQTIAEHRMYLPLAALVVGATVVLVRRWPSFATWGLGGVAAIFATLTVARHRDYADAVTIWSDTAAKVASARAENNLARALQQAGRLAEAETHFARAVALEPDYVSARHNWAIALLAQQRTAEAIAQFSAAIRAMEARAQRSPGSNIELADAHFQLALLAERAGDVATAERELGATLAAVPTHGVAHVKLGRLLARAQRFAAAERHLREAIRLAPDNPEPRALLGNSFLMQGRVPDAIACYEEALRLRPDDPRTRENLALAREALR